MYVPGIWTILAWFSKWASVESIAACAFTERASEVNSFMLYTPEMLHQREDGIMIRGEVLSYRSVDLAKERELFKKDSNIIQTFFAQICETVL